ERSVPRFPFDVGAKIEDRVAEPFRLPRGPFQGKGVVTDNERTGTGGQCLGRFCNQSVPPALKVIAYWYGNPGQQAVFFEDRERIRERGRVGDPGARADHVERVANDVGDYERKKLPAAGGEKGLGEASS